jgi:DNA-binding CsgD family transcriptional regulator
MRTRTSLVIESATTSPLPGPADELGLTDREHEVLLLLAEGRTNQQIGALLHIAAKTASVHVSNILRKLDVANRGEAAAVAHRLGLAPAPASHADPSVRLT